MHLINAKIRGGVGGIFQTLLVTNIDKIQLSKENEIGICRQKLKKIRSFEREYNYAFYCTKKNGCVSLLKPETFVLFENKIQCNKKTVSTFFETRIVNWILELKGSDW